MMLDIAARRRGWEMVLRGNVLAEDEVPDVEDVDVFELAEPVDALRLRVPVDTDPSELLFFGGSLLGSPTICLSVQKGARRVRALFRPALYSNLGMGSGQFAFL